MGKPIDHPEQLNLDSGEIRQNLAAYIRDRTQADTVSVAGVSRLPGGAIQENWALRIRLQGGSHPGERDWVLRTDSPSAVAASLTRAQEYAVLGVAHAAGIKVPEPISLCRDLSVIGRDFFLMERLFGVVTGHRLTKEQSLVPDGAVLAEELGANLARLHRVTPPRPELDFLPLPGRSPALATVAEYRNHLDAIGAVRPVLEWGLRWCEWNAPGEATVCLIHRDYRTGNYMVGEGRLAGILDWEFAGWGDPREDLGWFSARCWRFAGSDREAGGIAAIDPFLAGYEKISGHRFSREDLSYWQVMAHLRWAVIALQQAWRHISGQQRSLELALTGRLVPELEQEIIALTRGDSHE